ncbi:MAG TPA: hypothetical protein PLQ78_03185 [Flavipsychrobacter sp.]|nr:hypothetical protein [Flavipsychrobacter sp.]
MKFTFNTTSLFNYLSQLKNQLQLNENRSPSELYLASIILMDIKPS